MMITSIFILTAAVGGPLYRRLLFLVLKGFPPLFIALLMAGAGLAAVPAPPSLLVGTWTEINGPGAARIAACADAPDRLCATGLERRGDNHQNRAETGIVLSGIVADGANRWRGDYHDGRRRYPATLRLLGPALVEMKVCVLFICQSARYSRNS